MKTETTLITAHSGADGTPDNSMEFVRYVLGTQADVLEIDVRRGHNGNLIICHEEATRECVNLREIFMKVLSFVTKRMIAFFSICTFISTISKI